MLLLNDRICRASLYPFAHTRHVADIRVGIFTIREKWELLTGEAIITNHFSSAKDVISIPANLVPGYSNFREIIAAYKNGGEYQADDAIWIHHPWNIFELNDKALRDDFKLLDKSNYSGPGSGNHLIGEDNIYLEAGAKVSGSFINASTGPVYIGKNCEVMEGCMIRGPFAMLDGSVLKMGARIYGATTLGPGCIVGGEVKNSVFFGYSNKAHDGYLGDSVIGEWCNLGAGTSNSNIRNNAAAAKYKLGKDAVAIQAGLKAGLLMGDYSRCAINTSFNTASVVGVSCNIFGDKIPQVYTDHFTWGDTRYAWDKVASDINNWKRFKNKEITDQEIDTLLKIYKYSS